VTLSPLDDYPVHQIPEVMRHVGTSDRNFYDRYYFNAFPLTGDTMLIVGLGQYPNLGVTDAFALLRRGSAHRVVRASRELGPDRMNTRVGPFGGRCSRASSGSAWCSARTSTGCRSTSRGRGRSLPRSSRSTSSARRSGWFSTPSGWRRPAGGPGR